MHAGSPSTPGRGSAKRGAAIALLLLERDWHAEYKPEGTMKAEYKWIIVLVAYDDPRIEARVIKERLTMEEDEQLAALLRGGELAAVLDLDNESTAEASRMEVEKSCLR
jgi:hypothetical protein